MLELLPFSPRRRPHSESDPDRAALALSAEDPRLRASAVEFVDGSLPDRIRRLFVPLIDDIGAAEALRQVGRALRVEPLPPPRAYDSY